MRAQEVSPLGQTLHQRSRSLLIVLDSDYRIVLGESEAVRLLLPEASRDKNGGAQLPAELRDLIKERLDGLHNASDAAIGLGHLLLRLVPIQGAMGKFTAVTVETLRQREDLVSQRKKYRLTPREVDVLRLILKGLTAHEMAEVLNITKNTVTDYFKSLLRKTNSRNRSEMLAKILNYTSTGERAT